MKRDLIAFAAICAAVLGILCTAYMLEGGTGLEEPLPCEHCRMWLGRDSRINEGKWNQGQSWVVLSDRFSGDYAYCLECKMATTMDRAFDRMDFHKLPRWQKAIGGKSRSKEVQIMSLLFLFWLGLCCINGLLFWAYLFWCGVGRSPK